MSRQVTKKSMQAHIGGLLKEAASFARTAHSDIMKRVDRVDALDAIIIAKRKLSEAEASIRATMVFHP